MREVSLTFSVNHQGRGGELVARGEGSLICCPIEHVEAGVFAVHLRGAVVTESGVREQRLTRSWRTRFEAELRSWLEATGRERWTIER